MGIYNLIKSTVPLSFRIWLRRDAKMLFQRTGARLRGSGPIPPRDLIHLVIGVYDLKGFLESGATSADALRDALKEAGADVESLGRILDFGCGCGRIMRHWKGLRGASLHGTDFNPILINWCTANLPFAEFKVNALGGPLPYESNSFDLVYAYSVFTHLPPPLQSYWVGEMRRVLKPGGFLYVTLHGESCIDWLDAKLQKDFRMGRFVAIGEQPGTNYYAAYHPEAYVRGEFSRGFSVEVFRREGARGGSRQDAYLLKKI
jgi:ubiquinone/menaquinone biosynthesis C-methylase UbiE